DPASPVGRAVATVTARIGEDEFGALMKQLKAAGSRLRRHLDREAGVEGAISLLRARLGVTKEETVDGTLQSACAAASFDEAALRRAMQVLLAGSPTDVKIGQVMSQWLASDTAL